VSQPASHPLLTAPIGRSLLKLAGPTTAVMVVQTLVAIVETFIFGKLGTDALAGFALVFPLMMMMTMMAAGGMGGGVTAAMARAMGGRRLDDARALVLHSMLLAVAMSLLFTLFAWTVAPSLFRLLGGSGKALANAETYAHVLFTGALAIWLNFFFSSLLRGGGDAATPGRYMLLGSLVQMPLSAVLALGLGDWPGFGVSGPAISMLATSLVSAALQARALWGGKLGFRPSLGGIRLQRRLFWDILRVGLIASFSAFTANLTAMMVTGLVGGFGVAALAGYGIGVRMEFMLVPLAFGIGSALTGTGGPVLLLPLLMLCRQRVDFAVIAAQAVQLPVALTSSAVHAAAHRLDWGLAAVCGMLMLLGSLAGQRLARGLDRQRLQRFVSGLLLLVGAWFVYLLFA